MASIIVAHGLDVLVLVFIEKNPSSEPRSTYNIDIAIQILLLTRRPSLENTANFHAYEDAPKRESSV